MSSTCIHGALLRALERRRISGEDLEGQSSAEEYTVFGSETR